MRRFSAVTIMAMLASVTLVSSAFCASARWSKNTVGVPPYHYGWWDRNQWRGGWGPSRMRKKAEDVAGYWGTIGRACEMLGDIDAWWGPEHGGAV